MRRAALARAARAGVPGVGLRGCDGHHVVAAVPVYPAAQFLRHLGGAGVTLFGVARHGPGRDVRQRAWHAAAHLMGQRRVVGEHGGGDLLDAVASEGLAQRQQFVKHHAHGMHVGARVHRAAGKLLGRQVVRRARHRAVQRRGRRAVGHAGDAEIQHLGLVALVEKDIGRLDVAMHHAARVGVGQRIGHTAHQLCRLARRGRPAAGQALAQVAAVQAFHRDVDTLGREPGVVHGDDVRVRQPGRGARFVQEQAVQRHALGISHLELQRFHRHRAREQRVPGLMHLAQAALAQQALQRIAADVRQRGLLLNLRVTRRGLAVAAQVAGRRASVVAAPAADIRRQRIDVQHAGQRLRRRLR